MKANESMKIDIANLIIFNKQTIIDLATSNPNPIYLYFKEIITERINLLKTIINSNIKYLDNKKIYYAIKANSNLEILKIMKEVGIDGIDCVSPGEIFISEKVGFTADQILFTSSSSSYAELAAIYNINIIINFNNLETLECFAQKSGRTFAFSMRINLGKGLGQHEYIRTAGQASKFGVELDEMPLLFEMIEKYSLKLIGLHQHSGSNITDDKIEENIENLKLFFELINKNNTLLKDLQFVNIGGGFGIKYRHDDKELNLNKFFKEVNNLLEQQNINKNICLIVEPGRYLVAESGILLTKINTVKKKDSNTYIGCNTGMNHLIRPALYNSYHNIINISNNSYNFNDNILEDVDTDKDNDSTDNTNYDSVYLYGNICESSDYFIKNLKLKKSNYNIDDILAITNAGAYGYSMSSNYNSRLKPDEYLFEDNTYRLIRKKDTFDNFI